MADVGRHDGVGQKRARPRGDREDSTPWEAVQAPSGFIYPIPAGPGPRIFQKVEPTEAELAQMLARTPLRARLTATREALVPSSPLALSIGHVALLLASGQLDGGVQPEGGPPHLVRGTSRKREYVSDITETDNADGSTTTKTTLSEQIDLVVRTVDLTGRLRTLREDTDPEE